MKPAGQVVLGALGVALVVGVALLLLSLFHLGCASEPSPYAPGEMIQKQLEGGAK